MFLKNSEYVLNILQKMSNRKTATIALTFIKNCSYCVPGSYYFTGTIHKRTPMHPNIPSIIGDFVPTL